MAKNWYALKLILKILYLFLEHRPLSGNRQRKEARMIPAPGHVDNNRFFKNKLKKRVRSQARFKI
jgi:hypothetical protein